MINKIGRILLTLICKLKGQDHNYITYTDFYNKFSKRPRKKAVLGTVFQLKGQEYNYLSVPK